MNKLLIGAGTVVILILGGGLFYSYTQINEKKTEIAVLNETIKNNDREISNIKEEISSLQKTIKNTNSSHITETSKLLMEINKLKEEKQQFIVEKEKEVEKLNKEIANLQEQLNEPEEVVEEKKDTKAEEVKKSSRTVKDKDLKAKHITKKYDLMQGATFYTSDRDTTKTLREFGINGEKIPAEVSLLTMYFGVKDDGEIRLYIKGAYVNYDYAIGRLDKSLGGGVYQRVYKGGFNYFKAIQIKNIEKEEIYITLDSDDVERKSDGETMQTEIIIKNVTANSKKISNIIKSNKVYVKFIGDADSFQYEMTKEQLLSFREIISLYNYMNFE